MAVNTSNKATDSTVKDFKYWMGVIPYKVLAVNPTLEELKKIGVDYLSKEPEYTIEADYGNGPVKYSVIDFWVKSIESPELPDDLEVVTNLRFRINHEAYKGTNSGKFQFINKYGRTGWAEDVEGLNSNKYYINEGSRIAHRGEEELHKFLFAWLNMTYDTKAKQYDECLLDGNKLVTANFSEVKGLLPKFKDYVVKILTGVQVVEKDGKIRYYQTLYNQMFLKHNQVSTNRLEEYINKDEYTAFSTNDRPVYYSFEVKEFNKSIKPDSDNEAENVSANVNESVF